MNDLFSLVARHGYLLIFLIALAESIGLPMPAALALIAGGAAVAAHTLKAPQVIILPMIAMLLGDTLLFVLGRYAGWGLLGLLCRISVNPESCILRSAESFYKRGKITLLFSKFLPGINTMAAPLAGSMKMRVRQFLQLDFAGACLYTLTYCGLGYVFRDFLTVITHGIYTASHTMGIILGMGLGVYIGYRIWVYRKAAPDRLVPRVQVQELMSKLESEKNHDLLIVDVRSHGYYDSQAERIRGSIRLEPNNLADEAERFPKDKDIYLYCT
jgi:membrane protein DedA with SNARE-associated domain